jgi:hypothetical protein
MAVTAQVSGGIADLRHVGDGGGSSDGSNSGGGSVAKAVAVSSVSSVSAVSKTENSTLLRLLLCFFGKGESSYGQDDTSLCEQKRSDVFS